MQLYYSSIPVSPTMHLFLKVFCRKCFCLKFHNYLPFHLITLLKDISLIIALLQMTICQSTNFKPPPPPFDIKSAFSTLILVIVIIVIYLSLTRAWAESYSNESRYIPITLDYLNPSETFKYHRL